MSEPDTIQAQESNQESQNVSKNKTETENTTLWDTVTPGIELSASWKVPDYLNALGQASQRDREQILGHLESELNAVGGFSTTFQDINVQSTGIAMPRTIMAGGAIASILRTIGQSIHDDIIMAQQYAKDDELVWSHLRCKNLFFPSGFDISLNHESDKKRAAFKSFVRNPRIGIKKVCQDAMVDWNATDNIVLIWSVQKGEVGWLTAIDPSRCVYRNYNGEDRLDVILDVEAMREITSYINTGGPQNSGVSQGEIPQYPDRWKQAANKGGSLRLDREQGDGWAIVTRAHKYNGFARPGMRTVFFDLMLRDLLKAGEWACAIFLQSCIQHIKIGPADGDVKVGPRAGQKDYPFQKMLNSLNLMFSTPSRARRMITDSTVTIEHVVPDLKIFTQEKFGSCNARIDEWGGTPEPIRTGKGDGFAQGFLGFKRFEADGLDARDACEQAFDIFFNDPLVRHSKGIKLNDEDCVAYAWNKQILKDPKQVLAEISFMQNNGGIDWITVHELLGVNHDAIKTRMIAQHKELDDKGESIWRPVFEPRQGLLTEDKEPVDGGGEPGRPATGPAGRRPRAMSAGFGRGI